MLIPAVIVSGRCVHVYWNSRGRDDDALKGMAGADEQEVSKWSASVVYSLIVCWIRFDIALSILQLQQLKQPSSAKMQFVANTVQDAMGPVPSMSLSPQSRPAKAMARSAVSVFVHLHMTCSS
jgi:hypothetical protein